jgi:Ca2+-binding RTX toxin-like protein
MSVAIARKFKLTQTDLDFIWEQLRLPGNNPLNGVNGTIVDSTGIRDVKGVGNNVMNPLFGAADQLFVRETTAQWRDADGTFTFGQQGLSITNAPTSYATRDVNLIDRSARTISNLVAAQDADSLAAIGYLTPGEQKLAVLDDPSATPGGRISPITGTSVNALPYSSFMTLFGQFFDHGLDLVHKGADGALLVPLAPDDPLYNHPDNAIVVNGNTVGYNNFIIASRTDTVHVDISSSSTDALVAALGLREVRYKVGDAGVVSGRVTGAESIASGVVNGGVLIINKTAIDILNGSTANEVVAKINAVSTTTGVTASLSNTNQLVLDYAAGESRNTISPFIDLSQSYGSAASHTAFVREYGTLQVDGSTAFITTGRLVSGGADKNGDLRPDGMATWFDIKANARVVGVVLHDKDVLDIPEVRITVEGTPFLDARGMWLVARHQVTGQVHYVQDSRADASTLALRLNADGTTTEVTDAGIISNLRVQTIGHAFLDDMAHGVLRTLDSVTGEVVDPAARTLLEAHFIAGDGRANENIGLTAIHDVFHSEHNAVLIELQSRMTPNGDGTWTETANGRVWSGEDLFQSAKLVTEMQYQHMVFGEFSRHFSPNINAFASYQVTVDPAVSAEFAHAVYRFGHSMLTETVGLTAYDPVTGVRATGPGSDKSMGLIQAFLNPTAYGETTAGEIAFGMGSQVGNGIDVWVTDVLRNNLVGLPLDLATLNILRGRDSGIGSLNQIRADLYAQTGLESLKPYQSWDEFGANLLHPESLENFIMAYARDAILVQFSGNADLTYWNTLQNTTGLTADASHQLYATGLRGAAQAAMDNIAFMNGSTGLGVIDFWMGGLAEKKVPGGMLGATFDFLFAMQMISLQDADRFYYLKRLGGDLLAEIESQLFADIVMRNTGVAHLYPDIFSVPDASIEIGTPATATQKFATLRSLTLATADATDILGASRKVGRAGWVGSDATGWTFYGNPGEYLDARGVFSPNNIGPLKGNASEVIGGTDNAESINALGGNDAVYGDGGNDTIEGGDGNDFLRGGAGNDVITDQQGDDLIWGDLGNDLIQAGSGIDQVFGGDGQDTLRGGLGADVIEGGDGKDLIYGDTGTVTQRLVSGITVDAMDTNGDADAIAGGLGDDTMYGGGGDDFLDGGEGNDVLYGGLGNDLMAGGDGNDIFYMDASDIGFGNDMDGGIGYDIVDYSASVGSGLGAGVERFGVIADLNPVAPIVVPVGIPPVGDGFVSIEELRGSRFNDYLRGGSNLPLGLGLLTDAIGGVINFGTIALPVFRSSTVKLVGGEGNDTLEGGDGTGQYLLQADGTYAYVGWVLNPDGVTSTYEGGVWNPQVEGPGMDVLSGGLGIDTASYASAQSAAPVNPAPIVAPVLNLPGVTVNLALTGAQYTVNAGWDMLVGIENITGSAFDDTITGNAQANVLDGGDGNDTLNGGAGNDTLNGGAGDDSMVGGTGTDTVSYAGTLSTATVGATAGVTGVVVGLGLTTPQATLNAGLDTLVSIENVIGSAFNDTLSGGANTVATANLLDGGAGNDSLLGGGGNDTLIGGLGNDTLVGGDGSDTASYAGTTGSVVVNLSTAVFASGLGNVAANRSAGAAGLDTLTTIENVIGGDGNDTIVGSAAANVLTGGAGNDVLVGGAGNDVLDGGAGIDTASYATNTVAVTVNLTAGTATSAGVGGSGTDTLISIENAIGGSAADTLTGNAGANRLEGGGGADTLVASAGSDFLAGGAGTDIAVFAGTMADYSFIRDPNTGNIIVRGQFSNGQYGIYSTLADIESVRFGAGPDVAVSALPTNTPTVNSLVTNDTTPLITGRAVLSAGDTLSVTVANKTYTTQTIPALVLVQQGSTTTYDWSLQLPALAADAVYSVNAVVTEAGGSTAADITGNELVIDTTAPTVSRFTSTTPNGSYGLSSPIDITATMNEAVRAGSQMTVLLNTGDTVVLTAGANGTTLVGSYVVGSGDVSADLDVTTIQVTSVQDLPGNTMVSVAVPTGTNSLAGNKALVINAPVVVPVAINASFSTTTASTNEGAAGSATLSFLVALSGQAQAGQSVGWRVVSTGSTPATNADFSGALSGTLVFAAGATSGVIQVGVAGDAVREANETFRVILENPTGGLNIIGGTARGTIVNDDGAATLLTRREDILTTATGGWWQADRRNDVLDASASTQSVVFDGGDDNDTLTGGSAADQLIGGAGADVLIGGAGDDVLTGGTGADRLTGGAGRDTFVFAAGASGQATGSDTITDYVKGIVGTGDAIEYSSVLRVGGVATAATATQAAINQSTGVATFAAGSATTLADALADIATSFGADGAQTAGEFALFQVGQAGNFWMMVSDGTAGVTGNDVVAQLGGLTSVFGVDLSAGVLTITS